MRELSDLPLRRIAVAVFLSCLACFTGCEPEQTSASEPAPRPPYAQTAQPSSTSPVNAALQAELDAGGFKMSEFRSGKRYYELYCMTCHAAPKKGGGPDPASRLAPPPFAVAHHYKVGYPDVRERVDAIVRYTKRPSIDDALMPGAIAKFGPMSPMPLPEDQLRPIAIYLSLGEFKKPAWYDEHYAEEHGPSGQ